MVSPEIIVFFLVNTPFYFVVNHKNLQKNIVKFILGLLLCTQIFTVYDDIPSIYISV